jgi:hypothetical protein
MASANGVVYSSTLTPWAAAVSMVLSSTSVRFMTKRTSYPLHLKYR